ncbi:PepSY domain-containing protein [Simplicispira lacusdiani]|uniref:PepSY domain-containing protein n=1 Tax=Simplicispira lacusdiani TaxID=2213010 RepID=UPI000E730317|nr:PepSY domain-containing protein [Simplicispira lacusdiani]
MNTRYFQIAAAALSLLATSAYADSRCTSAPSATAVTQETVLRQLADAGHTIERFEVTKGQCYKMRGWDKAGNRVKMVFDPADGRIVKSELHSRAS